MTRFILAAAFSFLAIPAMADGMKLMVEDAYARASTPTAKAGAAFMTIMNMSDTDDRLIAASTDAAKRVELHTHVEASDGVMRMVEVKDGFEVPAGGSAMLARGGNHVMMMGLTQPFVHGQTIDVTLTFEQAGDMTVTIPIDLKRTVDHGGHAGHDHSGHSDMKTN